MRKCMFGFKEIVKMMLKGLSLSFFIHNSSFFIFVLLDWIISNYQSYYSVSIILIYLILFLFWSDVLFMLLTYVLQVMRRMKHTKLIKCTNLWSSTLGTSPRMCVVYVGRRVTKGMNALIETTSKNKKFCWTQFISHSSFIHFFMNIINMIFYFWKYRSIWDITLGSNVGFVEMDHIQPEIVPSKTRIKHQMMWL